MNSIRKMHVSQDAFDAVVKENMDDFGMELDEALEDAIKIFKMQGVDLKGIITDGSGSGSITNHPVVKAIKELELATSGILETLGESGVSLTPTELVTRALERLFAICKDGGPEILSIAGKYGGVEACTTAWSSLGCKGLETQTLAFKALNVLLGDVENKEKFRHSGGPEMLMSVVNDNDEMREMKLNACIMVSAFAMGDELAKESLMDLHVEEVLIKLLKEYARDEALVLALCNAFCSLVAAADNRVIASKAFNNARKFAENGMVDAILSACHLQSSTTAVSALCGALKSLAVNVM